MIKLWIKLRRIHRHSAFMTLLLIIRICIIVFKCFIIVLYLSISLICRYGFTSRVFTYTHSSYLLLLVIRNIEPQPEYEHGFSVPGHRPRGYARHYPDARLIPSRPINSDPDGPYFSISIQQTCQCQKTKTPSWLRLKSIPSCCFYTAVNIVS